MTGQRLNACHVSHSACERAWYLIVLKMVISWRSIYAIISPTNSGDSEHTNTAGSLVF